MQGEHVTILGPTKSGKTRLAMEIAEMRDYSAFLACKPADPLIDELRPRGWKISPTMTDLRIQDGAPLDTRFVYWPAYADIRDTRRRRKLQADALRRALDYFFQAGGWCIVADETLWLDALGLDTELETIWYQGRSNDVTLIALSQRPAWIPRAAYSQAEHLFIFRTTDRDDLKRLADIAGIVDLDVVRQTVGELERHEFLYVRGLEGTLLRCMVDVGGGR